MLWRIKFTLSLLCKKISIKFAIPNARIAQLVEHDLAKVGVAGSSPVSRSKKSLDDITHSGFFYIYTLTPTLQHAPTLPEWRNW